MKTDNIQLFLEYSLRANERLYASCRPAFGPEVQQAYPDECAKIKALLNHLITGDRIWLDRFEGGSVPSTGLMDCALETIDELIDQRRKLDERIQSFFNSLTEGFFEGEIEYVNNRGDLHRDPVDLLVAHFFNHQTYHRGQVNAWLNRIGLKPPSLDMHRVMRPDPVQ